MVLENIFANIGKILTALTPTGVEPVYFYSTFMIVIALSYMLFYTLVPPLKDHKGVSFIVSLVFAYFSASSAFVTVIVSKLFPNVGLVIMAVLGMLLVIAFVTPGSFSRHGTPAANLIMLVAFIFILFSTYTYAVPELVAQGYISSIPSLNISTEDWAIIIVVIFILAGLYMMLRPAPGAGETGGDRFIKWFTKHGGPP
jgi:hypothetical protein